MVLGLAGASLPLAPICGPRARRPYRSPAGSRRQQPGKMCGFRRGARRSSLCAVAELMTRHLVRPR